MPRVAASTGTMPATRLTASARPKVTNSTRQSIGTAPIVVAVLGSSARTAGRDHQARIIPMAPPAIARIALSAAAERMRLMRPAPSAARSANSPRRFATSATVRLARFATAINASASTAMNNVTSAGRAVPNCAVRMVVVWTVQPPRVCGASLPTSRISRFSSAVNCAGVTPGFSRATDCTKVAVGRNRCPSDNASGVHRSAGT